MREIIETANQWRENGQAIALATVVKTWGSAPRGVGAKMIISAEGAMVGSVSGGCVEGAVVEAAHTVLATGIAQLLEFGVTDEAAWDVGLACGGKLSVFVEPFQPTVQAMISKWISNGESGAVASLISGTADTQLGQKLIIQDNQLVFTTYDPSPARPLLIDSISKTIQTHDSSNYLLPDGKKLFFIDVITPPPTLIIVGGVHIAQALIKIAQVVGFTPIIIDPRRAFGNPARFPDVQLLPAWPRKAFAKLNITAATAIALLTHDPKIDDQALALALPSAAFYIGALGSKSTARKRVERLREAGFSEEEIGRIHAPIGLNIHSKTPSEIALSIMAEIIATYRGNN